MEQRKRGGCAEEERGGGGERDNGAEAKVEAAFITEHDHDRQSNEHLLPLFYRSVSFY